MEKNLILDTLIKEILSNGEKMSITDIQAAAKRKLAKEDYNSKQLYNFIYNMKNRGEIQKTTDGRYYIGDPIEGTKNSRKSSCEEVSLDEFEDFEIIDPLTVKSPKEVLSVMNSGTVGLNSALLKHFEDFCAEIRLKKDCTEIVLLKSGKVMTNLGKQGRVKNYNLVERLKQANMKLPLYYVGEWDDVRGLWHGKFLPYNPNKGKKEKQR